MNKIACTSAMLFLLASPCLADFGMHSVTGIVTDKRGNALPGAAVQVENMNTLAVSSYITGPDGRYHYNLVNGNTSYTVKAKYRRYWSKTKTLSKFNSSSHPKLNLVIPID